MKALALVAVLLALPALAQRPMPTPHTPVYPRVYNYSSHAVVEAWNHNDRSVWCTGSLTLWLASGKTDRAHVSLHVWGRGYGREVYRISDLEDRITSISHSVWCN
jgi:hypothetical protein